MTEPAGNPPAVVEVEDLHVHTPLRGGQPMGTQAMVQALGAVMYLGNIVELGTTAAIFEGARHPYTRSLLSALPSVSGDRMRRRVVLQGDPPTPIDPPPGCPFAGRCPKAEARCRAEKPALAVQDNTSDHLVACHYPEPA